MKPHEFAGGTGNFPNFFFNGCDIGLADEKGGTQQSTEDVGDFSLLDEDMLIYGGLVLDLHYVPADYLYATWTRNMTTRAR